MVPLNSAVIGNRHRHDLSMVAAGLAGAVIPLILTMLDQDPARFSTIILTPITDCVGFGTFLGIVTLAAHAGWLH